MYLFFYIIRKELIINLNTFSANKRFYKNVDVVSSGNQYEITLDSNKLKTPNGSVFCVNSELLALGVAHEWSSQKDLIMLSQMHLNALSNVCIDNPTQITKYDLVDSILNFLDTDTILFFSDPESMDPPGLLEKQSMYTRRTRLFLYSYGMLFK